MPSTLLLAFLVGACFLGLCGANVYLIRTLIRGVRAEDATIDRISRQSGYVIAELSMLARAVRALPRGGAAAAPPAAVAEGEPGSHDDDAAQAAFEEFQRNGFQEICEESLDAHNLVREMTTLKGKELDQWKSANEERIQNILSAQAELHGRLMASRQALEAANSLVRELRAKNQRLQGADARAKALDAINQTQDAELATARNTIARINGKLVAAQQKAEAAEREMARREAAHREQFDTYVDERQQLEKERQATELRLQSLQKAFDESLQQINQDKLLQKEHEKFLAQTQGLKDEKSALEHKLDELQKSFDRALVEKAFIESVLLDFDSALDPLAA
ncbi:MAG TPA: hypothetical protein VFF03_08600 [Rhodocyclaceae bacterium]|nr:hypothetical protein [Rhodocyclaceae bacterium]